MRAQLTIALLLIAVLAASRLAAQSGDGLAGAPEPLANALRKLMADEGYWASTRTTKYLDVDGRIEQTDIERYDPSLPPDERWVLLARDGRPPGDREIRSWRRQREREMRRRGRPLGAIMDFSRATLAEETRTHWVYSVPIQPGVSRRLPAEKFYVLAQVAKERGEIDRIAIRTNEKFRIAALAKVENAEVDVRFDIVDEDYPAQPVRLEGAGEARVVWLFRVGGGVETTWSKFERVVPYDSRFTVTIGELKALDF